MIFAKQRLSASSVVLSSTGRKTECDSCPAPLSLLLELPSLVLFTLLEATFSFSKKRIFEQKWSKNPAEGRLLEAVKLIGRYYYNGPIK